MKKVTTISDIEENLDKHPSIMSYSTLKEFIRQQITELLESAPLEIIEWEQGKLMDSRMIDGWNNKIKDFKSWLKKITN